MNAWAAETVAKQGGGGDIAATIMAIAFLVALVYGVYRVLKFAFGLGRKETQRPQRAVIPSPEKRKRKISGAFKKAFRRHVNLLGCFSRDEVKEMIEFIGNISSGYLHDLGWANPVYDKYFKPRYAGARSLVNAHFGVKSIDELTVAQVVEAIAFVQAKIDAQTTKELPPAPAAPASSVKELPPGATPVRSFWVSFSKKRNYAKAQQTIRDACKPVYDMGTEYTRRMKDAIQAIHAAYDPTPNECRPRYRLDALVTSLTQSMEHHAEVAHYANQSFAAQCSALIQLANLLEKPDFNDEPVERFFRAG